MRRHQTLFSRTRRINDLSLTSSTVTIRRKGFLIALALAATGILVAAIDDPRLPGLGSSGVGILPVAVAMVLVVGAARTQLPTWTARAVMVAAFLAEVVVGAQIHPRG